MGTPVNAAASSAPARLFHPLCAVESRRWAGRCGPFGGGRIGPGRSAAGGARMVWQFCHRLALNPSRRGGGIAPRRTASGLASRLADHGFPIAAAAPIDWLRRCG